MHTDAHEQGRNRFSVGQRLALQSGRGDLNPRPPRPERGALTKLRYFPCRPLYERPSPQEPPYFRAFRNRRLGDRDEPEPLVDGDITRHRRFQEHGEPLAVGPLEHRRQ